MSVRRSAVDGDGPPVIMASGPWMARVTTSLGICAIQAVMQPDLLGALSASDREGPPVAGVNDANGAAVCY